MPIDTDLNVWNGRNQGESHFGQVALGLLQMGLQSAAAKTAHADVEMAQKEFQVASKEAAAAKTTEELLNVKKKYDYLAGKPGGGQFLSALDDTVNRVAQQEAGTEVKQMQLKMAQQRGVQAQEMLDEGLDPFNQAHVIIHTRQKNEDKFRKEMNAEGKDISGLIKPEDFNDHGYWTTGAKDRIAKDAPRSEILQSRELIASNRLQALTDRFARTQDNAERRILNEQIRLELQQRGFGLREIDQQMKAFEMGVAINPSTSTATAGSPAPTLTPVARPPTTGTLTQSQEASVNADRALSSLTDAIGAIQNNPESMGPQGIGRAMLEKATGIINPRSQVPTPITDARQKASMSFSAIAKSLRVDSGNMSKYELNKLEQAGDVLAWDEAPQTALRKLDNLRAATIGTKLRNLKLQNAKPEDNLLKQIPLSDLPALYWDGLFSLEDANRWKALQK